MGFEIIPSFPFGALPAVGSRAAYPPADLRQRPCRPPRPVSSEKVRYRAHPPDRSPIRTTAYGHPAEHCRVRASPRSMLSCILPPSATGTCLDGPRPFFGKETVPEGDEDDSAPQCHRIPTAAGPVTHRSAAPSASSFPANRSRKGSRNAPTAATVRSGSGHTRRYGPIQ